MKAESLGVCVSCEEGDVYAVVIPALELRGHLCRECEAFWAEGEAMSEENADQLVAMLHDAGLWPPQENDEPAVFFLSKDKLGQEKYIPW
jgi:NMD protein affecting ribosome stability and mRNA decay